MRRGDTAPAGSMSAMLDAVVEKARQARGIAGKTDIAGIMDTLLPGCDPVSVRIGDDCAAIADHGGWLLFAIEGFVNEFVAAEPWFAGYCGIMVNLSDIAAMGGHATAVVDALWSRDHAHARAIAQGMATAARVYGVPIVGGHSNARSSHEQLSVAVIGRAKHLLTSFDAQAGDTLVAAIDLRGRYREPWPNWDCSTGTDAARLRADLAILPALAEAGLARAAKDISMAGLIGTAMMLAECSEIGLAIDIDAVPRPKDADPARWLCETFPSYGFVLAVKPEHVDTVVEHFHERDIACSPVGTCNDSRRIALNQGPHTAELRDLAQERYIGCQPRPSATPPSNIEAHHA